MYVQNYVGGVATVQTREIAIREKLKGLYAAEFVQPFLLRAAIKLENGKSNYKVLMGKDSGKTKLPGELLLQNNDAFAPVCYRVLVQKQLTVAGKAYGGNARRYQYPEAAIFDGAADPAGFSEAENIQAIYTAGVAELGVDGAEIIYKLAVSETEYVPQSVIATKQPMPASGSNMDLDSFRLLQKEFVLFGGNENVFELDIEGASTQSIARGVDATPGEEDNVMWVEMYGAIVRGGGDKVRQLDMYGVLGKDGKWINLK